MKRFALLGVVLIAVLACTAALSTPKPAHAILCCDNAGYTTSQHWHMAATCAEAQTAYRAAARADAAQTCGSSTAVCAMAIPACYQSGSMWVVDGIATFGCKEDCGPIYPQQPY
jgi:hypothetical protein